MVNIRKWFCFILSIFLISYGIFEIKVAFSQKKVRAQASRGPAAIAPGSPESPNIKNVFAQIEAKVVGEKTHALLNAKTQQKLNEYAELIVSKTAFQEQQNPLYINNPDLHRLLCFFVTSYVYAAESQNLPPETQIYLVIENSVTRDELLKLEIQKVQHVFNQCRDMELQIHPTGLVYFKWDINEYLNGIPVDVEKPKTALQEIPEAFRGDPLLSQLYVTAAEEVQREAQRDHLGDEMVTLLLEGVKNQLASGNPNLVKLATKFGAKAGQKVGKRVWKERTALIQSLTRDDANLFSVSAVERDTAKQLTKLVAVPGVATVSTTAFQKTVKSILESDIQLKYKIGKDMIYAGFTLNFK